jgi:hypothetical protein
MSSSASRPSISIAKAMHAATAFPLVNALVKKHSPSIVIASSSAMQ